MYAAGNRSAVFKDRKKSFTPEIETMNTLPERSALQDIALDYDMCVMSRGTLQDFISHAAEHNIILRTLCRRSEGKPFE